jgi:hypothetical protein
MKRWLRPFQIIAAIALVVSLVCQGTMVLAGTTGTLTGQVNDVASHLPLAGAKVTVTSPSQSASVATDSSGHFAFLSLSPDTYLLSVTYPGYDQSTVTGVTVIADASRTVNVTSSKTLQTIGKVTSRSSTDLVKPGTTADVYSINPTQQDKLSGLGGGGNLNSAFSALASVPGVYVAPGTAGYNTFGDVSIRGGDYDQVGYEVDGVPINRAFDSYPSGTTSSLGQQELQVYTGAAPANAEAQGISGYINQVIKTGTYPASTLLTGDLGGPAYYHKFSIETGGATASRNFSYYIGLGGYNQDFRYVDQFNGSGVGTLYGTPIAPCEPLTPTGGPTPAQSCYNGTQYNGFTGGNYEYGSGSYVLGSAGLLSQSSIADRTSVVNLHFGLPHKDGTKDDLQLLLDVDHLATQYYDSTNDQGGAAYLTAIGFGTPFYIDGYQYNGTTGGLLPKNYTGGGVAPYLFPNSGSRPFSDLATGNVVNIPVNERDGISNDQNIAKIQYTKTLGTNALLKVYGYTYYSDWLQNGPQGTYADYIAGSSPDYELESHTRGVSAQFTDQLGSNNLLTFQGAYTTASTLRDNNTEMFDGLYGPTDVNNRTVFAALVDSSNPYSGTCYTKAGAPVACFSAPTSFNSAASFLTLLQAYNGGVPAATGKCGGGPCQYLVVGNGQYATYNTVTPQFTSVSLTDEFKPTSKLTIDGGIRLDRYAYVGSDTTGTPARTFFYNAFNLDTCVTTKAPIDLLERLTPGGACPAGSAPADFTNPSGNVTEAYNEYQPRVGATYSLDPATVVRANYGRFAQAPSSAYQQYNALQPDAPGLLYGTYGFQTFGFTTPNHTVTAPTSDNLDFSLEHQFGRDTSIKFSPFLRKTQNQIQNFYLNQESGFVSGLNVGDQTSEGFEFELDKGNFSRNGLAAKLSLAYTNSYIKYQPLTNGSSVIAPLNAQIKTYNAYTSFCASNPTAAECAGGTTASGAVGAPCYTTGGAAVLTGCTAADIANPYWNAPPQGLLDPNGNYASFDTITSGIGSSVAAYGAPYTATLLVQYKHDKFAITPALQFFAGQRYGAPSSTLGIAPDTCAPGAALGPTAGDPRYSYGSAGGSSFNYADCGQITGGIPDPYTGKFDNIGQFVSPSNLLLHVQLSYDITPRVSLVVNVVNILNECFGGSKTGFTVPGACGYGIVGAGTSGDIGNLYNPGQAIQPYVNTPYDPTFASIPFGVFVSARVKI